MVHCCCVPNCSSRSDRETDLSFFHLPLNNRRLLNRWVHVIRQTNLPIHRNTRICSRHFVNAKGRRLYPNEVPSLSLPRPSTATRTIPRKPSKNRSTDLNDEPVMTPEAEVEVGVDKEGQAKQDASTQTEMDLADLAMTESKVLNLEEKLNETEKKLREVEKKLQKSKFSLNNIKNNDTQVTFFTGFPSF